MPAASANNEHERQTLAAELSRLLEQAADASFNERSRTHGRQRKFITLSNGDYVALWIAYQRTSKLSPYIDIRRVKTRVSDSAYILERWNRHENGTNDNQKTIICHIDRLDPIPPPRDLPAAEALKWNITAVQEGLGVIERISMHRKRRGRAKGAIDLRVHWVGIDDATEIAHNLNCWINPTNLTRCKIAQEYLATLHRPSPAEPTPTAVPTENTTPTIIEPAPTHTKQPRRQKSPKRPRTISATKRTPPVEGGPKPTTTTSRRLRAISAPKRYRE